MDVTSLRIGIVGASLGGLSVANVLERAGARVTLLERAATGFDQRGGGLGVTLALARAVGGAAPPPPHLVHDRRHVWLLGSEWEEPAAISVTSYGSLWRWLRERLRSTTVVHGCEVVGVDERADAAHVRTADGQTMAFDLVVAADGGTSPLRAHIEGAAGPRVFAGYVLWRGTVTASALDDARHDLVNRFHVANRGNHHFVAYAIPSHAGSTAHDDRLMNWGWYHPLPPHELLALPLTLASRAPHALDREPSCLATFEAVLERDAGQWPSWVQHIVERTMAAGAIAPHPVHETIPGRLASGRLVLVGDAAHLASPITGSGARMAMDDALALGRGLETEPSIARALAHYADARKAETTRIVQAGQQHGAAFRAAPTFEPERSELA